MKSILLIGLGRFGRHIAQELNELGHQVMAIDSNEDRVNAVLSYVTNAQDVYKRQVLFRVNDQAPVQQLHQLGRCLREDLFLAFCSL